MDFKEHDMDNRIEVTRVITENIEILPCIKCGSTAIRFTGTWFYKDLNPVENPQAICSSCGFAPNVGDRKFKDPYEHHMFWNAMNTPKYNVEFLVSTIEKLRQQADDLDSELAQLVVRFPELINEEYSFGKLLNNKTNG